jgi:lipopolysaccharide-induced tumor necrosis factor-alpha factor
MYTPVQPGQQVVIANTSPVMAQSWTNTPQVAYCGNCRSQGVTNVKYAPGACTWLTCVGCVCVGCYLGCCLIPFCVDGLQDCTHYCSNCGEFLGKKNII